ncbi:hypothetical protein HF1_12310 [Mycoplasma haemofelis str. Langford 1]|uniref:Lipoprotein n=1 Tax=Mycoplasma haemofelis (strain Langford 1) TaxID=941640 RepID=E8ZJB8_MYCHL|nr:hypothetical protein [Mycoplasma haemofelis]CBY93239.1 hypothetical protein HF1_12310 [Mycoplasma haemofelis str. Langford 1]
MKFGSAALVGGTAAAGMASAAAGYYAFSPSDKEERVISSLLSEDPSRRAIADNEDWSSAWSKYKASNKDVWDLKNSDAEVPEVFKTACKNRLESKVSGRDSEGYRDFVSYCTRDTLVSDLIKDRGKELLDKSKGGSDAGWIKVWKDYISDDRNKSKAKDGDIWKLTGWETENSKNDKAPDVFMTACESNAKKPIYDFNNSLFLDTFKFCTKDTSVSVGV